MDNEPARESVNVFEDTDLAAVDVRSVEEIERQCCHEVDEEPAFHVVHGDAFAIADHFALPAHVRRSEVQSDIWRRITGRVFAIER